MKLLYQTHSPFARKVLVFAHETGIVNQIEVVHHETSPTNRNEEVFALNPLGKVPVLITDQGDSIIESSVICDYLDNLHSGTKLIPSILSDRMQALQMQAIADGISEAGILVRWESTRRPEELRYSPFLNGQLEKVISGYGFIEENINLDGQLNIGHIAIATSISWLEFRGVAPFRNDYPKLTSWYDAFTERASMCATTLVGDTHD